jgi:hypothetical protein
MKKFKEIRLGVDSNHITSPKLKYDNDYMGGMTRGADSQINRINNLYIYDEDSIDSIDAEEEEDILEYRIIRNNKYSLAETLSNIKEYHIHESLEKEGLKFYYKYFKYGTLKKLLKNLGKDKFTKVMKELGPYLPAMWKIKDGTRVLDKGVKLGKQASLMVPVLDIVLGSYYIVNGIKKINESINRLHNNLFGERNIDINNIIENLFINKENFNLMLCKIQNLEKEKQASIKSDVETVLAELKFVMVSIIGAYDTIVELFGGPAAPITLTLGNIITTLLDMALVFVPIEQWAFQYLSNRNTFIHKFSELIKVITNTGDSKDSFLSYSLDYINKNVTTDPVARSFFIGLTQPLEFLGRFGDLYRAASGEKILDNEACLSMIGKFNINIPEKSKKAKYDEDDPRRYYEIYNRIGLLNIILENKIDDNENDDEDDNEDIEEMSAGAIGGYALPLGSSNKPKSKRKDHHKLLEKEKKINEQLDAIRRLQLYHHKTTNNLK